MPVVVSARISNKRADFGTYSCCGVSGYFLLSTVDGLLVVLQRMYIYFKTYTLIAERQKQEEHIFYNLFI